MNLKKHRGFIYTIIYYLIGLLTSYIVYLIFGWTYIHSPGFHHLTFIFFLIGSIIWSMANIITLIKRKSRFHKESLFVHSIVFGVITIMILIVLNSEPQTKKTNNSRLNSITMTNKRDTSLLISDRNDTIYFKIKDSIYIDRMKDSLFMNSIMNE